jgi:DNA-binding CsgD family transcriptional regulator
MGTRLTWALPVAVVGLSIGLAWLDLWTGGEAFEPADFAFDVAERAILFASVSAVAWLTVQLRDLRMAQAAMRGDLARAVAMGEAWRRGNSEALDDVAAAIQQQFTDWALTPAEADIAGLILKGASLRDIAALRSTADATIRQQAQSIYRKSGLGGRRELAAYFLESLFETREAAAP